MQLVICESCSVTDAREQLCTLSRSTSCGSHMAAVMWLKSESHLFSLPFCCCCCLELEGLLGKFGQDARRIEDSVLIGCSSQQEAWFALDLGLSGTSSVCGACLFLIGAPDRCFPLFSDFRILCNTISSKTLYIQKLHQLFSLNKTPLSTIITMKL